MVELKVDTREIAIAGAANANQRWSARTSWLLTLTDGPLRGYGEAAPLLNFSRESPAELQSALAHLQRSPRLVDAFNRVGDAAATAPSRMPTLADAPASLQFAMQSAWLDLRGQRLGVPTWRLLSEQEPAVDPVTPEPRPAAQLFSLDQPDLDSALAACGSAPALKVKIGRNPPAEMDQLRLLRARWAKPLRLDANGSLGADWEATLVKLAACDPEFVEEPRPLAELGRPRRLPCPIAFDESLLSAAPDQVEAWLQTGGVSALVLKPMLLGDLGRVQRWVRLARRYDVACIFSHLFDGTVAMASYQHLALAWGDPRLCSGLGAHAGLALWPHCARSLSAPGLGLQDH